MRAHVALNIHDSPHMKELYNNKSDSQSIFRKGLSS